MIIASSRSGPQRPALHPDRHPRRRINEYADRIVHMEDGRITGLDKGTAMRNSISFVCRSWASSPGCGGLVLGIEPQGTAARIFTPVSQPYATRDLLANASSRATRPAVESSRSTRRCRVRSRRCWYTRAKRVTAGYSPAEHRRHGAEGKHRAGCGCSRGGEGLAGGTQGAAAPRDPGQSRRPRSIWRLPTSRSHATS